MEPDDVLTHFAPLLAVLEVAASRRDYESPVVREAIVYGARSARAAGVPPERVLSQLRTHLHGGPLADVDCDRGLVIEHVVLRLIASYYAETNAAP